MFICFWWYFFCFLRAESCQYQNFCMCFILLLTSLSDVLVSSICVPWQERILYSVFSTTSFYAASVVSSIVWPSSCLLCLSLKQWPTLCFEEVVAICSETMNYLLHRLEGKVCFTKIYSQPQKNNKGQFIISTVGGRNFEIANHKFGCIYQHVRSQ